MSNTHMKAGWLFWYFLEPSCKIQPTRSPRLPNGFWWFLMQNEAGVLLVSFLCPVYYFCLVEKSENFRRSLELCFTLLVFRPPWTFRYVGRAQVWLVYGQNRHNNSRNNEYYVRHHGLFTKHNLKTLYTKYEVNRGIIILSMCVPIQLIPPQNLLLYTLITAAALAALLTPQGSSAGS